MLINLESHINMKHTQTRSREREEEEKYIRKKGWTITKRRLLNVVVILNPKQTVEDETFIMIKNLTWEIFWCPLPPSIFVALSRST
jgi:hypothetical protein